jgi:hypothetical protein
LEQDEHHLEQLAIWACTTGRRSPELQSKIRALLADRSATSDDLVAMIAEVKGAAGSFNGTPMNASRSGGRAPTVTERMADTLQSEPRAIWWTAKEWAAKLSMSPTAVTLSETWMGTIKYSRELLKHHQSVRRRRT